MAVGDSLGERVDAAVDAWLRWLPRWTPATHRGRTRICGKCTGSPLVRAAGIPEGVPHQVVHALVTRMHRIIDRDVDVFTERELPVLHRELSQAAEWNRHGYDPHADAAPEVEGIDPDPVPEPGEPVPLFTLAGLAEEAREAEPTLPQPPLTPRERERLREEIARADQHAAATGAAVCTELSRHSGRIVAAIERFVEPQVQALLDELGRHLETPN